MDGDPHARMRYQVGRTWRTVHPDAVAELTVDGQRRWLYLEVDWGTAELRRHAFKLRRYARFYLSGIRQRDYERFPRYGSLLPIGRACPGLWGNWRTRRAASVRSRITRSGPN